LKIKFYIVVVFSSLLFSCSISRNSTKQSKGSAVTGTYRNLFSEAGYTSAAITEKLNGAFNKLFHGNTNTETVYYNDSSNADGKLAYIHDVNNNDVRSEGMSYGMMIAVQLNKKQEFDALWNWSKSYMYNSDPSHPANGFFSWSVKTNRTINDAMPAPDGEEYFVTALYFASARWGNGQGIYNYQAEADRLLNDMLHRSLVKGITKNGPITAVNLFDTIAKMVRFTPDLINANHTDASYHLPAFYEVWSRIGPKSDRTFWKSAAQTSRDYFEKTANGKTALTPEYGNFDGTPWAAPWNKGSADFRFDARRCVMNWSLDWEWWSVDKRVQDRSNRLLDFFTAEGIHTYGNQYSLSGKKLEDGQPTSLIAMNATAALAATDARGTDFVKALWNTAVPTGEYRYYDGMLYMIALLICSGEYKCYIGN
jgi:oligosaccharide reducing-end xylanase